MILLVTALPADFFFRDPLAVPVFADVNPPHREAGRIDFRLGGILTKWIADGTVDPNSNTPTLFNPGSDKVFPQLVISGAGNFAGLTPENAQNVMALMTETLLRAGAPTVGLAARDFRRAHTPPRDSADAIVRAIKTGADKAGGSDGRTMRVHWDEDEADKLAEEMRRCRHLFKDAIDWKVERAPEDERYIPEEGGG